MVTPAKFAPICWTGSARSSGVWIQRQSYRLHALKGDLKGYWSVTGRANRRIIFRLEGPGASSFREDFVSRNLFGEGVSAKSWAQWNGIDFAFVTAKDLVELTRGFKVAVKLPATYILTANNQERVEEY